MLAAAFWSPIYPSWEGFARRLSDLGRAAWRPYAVAAVVGLVSVVLAVWVLGRFLRGLRRLPGSGEKDDQTEA